MRLLHPSLSTTHRHFIRFSHQIPTTLRTKTCRNRSKDNDHHHHRATNNKISLSAQGQKYQHQSRNKRTNYSHRYQRMDESNEPDLTPQKQLLMDAAAEIRSDQVKREEAKAQNVGEGTLKLLGESAGGIVLGAAAVVMGPVQGYKQSGPKGIPGGLLGGLAVGVASTTMGVGNGIASFVQGSSKSISKLNPPKTDPRLNVDPLEHIHRKSSYHDRKTNSTSKNINTSSSQNENENENENENVKDEIKHQYLNERKILYGELMAEFTAQNAAASMDGLQPPVDNKLYSDLQVDVDATPSQIRKAYYRMAQLYHPDKHPGDPEATERFQKISNAYQILSDPVKREEYHRMGESAASNEEMMDPKKLFILMFADFEHIVGDLATATILMSGQDEMQQPQQNEQGEQSNVEEEQRRQAREEKRKQFQESRENQLVKLLERRLQPWMDGDEESFINHAKHEVLFLRDQPFGTNCLHTAAYIYKKRAMKVIESKGPFQGVSNFFEDIGDKAHSLKSKFRAIEGGVKAITSNERGDENETHDDTARREAIDTLAAVWLTSVVDIESTLRKVVSKFLNLGSGDSSNKAEMKKRAQGLMILSKIFDQA